MFVERIAGIVLPVLLVILTGFLYARRAEPDMRAINRLNIELLCPLLVFSALASKEFDLLAYRGLLLGALVIVLGSGLLAWPIAKLLKVNWRTFVPPMMFNNCGNMGLPLAVLAFGAKGLGPAVAVFVVSNTLHFTLGQFLVNRQAQLRTVLHSPMIWATVLGTVVALIRLPVPAVIMVPAKLLGDATIPLMLFALGCRMTTVSLRGWKIGFIGAIVCPLTGILIALLVADVLRLQGQERGLLFVFAALPPAVLNFLVAEQYKQEPDKVASIVLLGNIGALAFVPLGLYLGLR
ncbi:MAG TPA: AEC family transporter [Burkholderiaceae bacterium]|nr:AEC family transporter [Burkholderiaceae bacterium]